MRPRVQVNWDLPPISTLPDMFSDMSRNALDQGLREALKQFQGRSIKIATMCSGTESPIFALELIVKALSQMGFELSFTHMFSAEIVPFKQAFIQRNLAPPILFRDITQIKLGHTAPTVFGAEKAPPPPGEVHVLVVGFSCVDFSNLNNKKRPLESDTDGDGRASGESGVTFDAVRDYARDFRPPIMIIENVDLAPWDRLVTEWEKIQYAAAYVRIDTKMYYIPQTRRRGYMICINYDGATSSMNKSAAQSATAQWAKVMRTLSRPASSPIEHFLLEASSPQLQRALDQLVEPRKVSRLGWTLSKDRHATMRLEGGLGDGNPYTHWRSKLRLPTYVAKKWLIQQPTRIKDVLDIIVLSNAARDNDIAHKASIVNISQNVDRRLDVVAPGLVGCITPNGLPYSMFFGRPLVGLECLSLQGLPAERIQLTTESQSELSDLAGNAMTSTVAGAALLAAFAAAPMALTFGPNVTASEEETPSVNMDTSSSDPPQPQRNDAVQGVSLQPWVDFGVLEAMSVAALMELAGKTRQLCCCEDQHRISKAPMMKCRDCFTSICKSCVGSPSHNLARLTTELPRLHPSAFTRAISKCLPTRIRLDFGPLPFHNTDGSDERASTTPETSMEEKLHGTIEDSLGQELHIRSPHRGTNWKIAYSSSKLKLELQVDASSATWLLFVQPPDTEPGNSALRQLLSYPVARMRPRNDGPDVLTGNWEIRLPRTRKSILSVRGNGSLVPSWRNELGLKNFSNEWVWSSLIISGSKPDDEDSRDNIDGVWDLLPGCGTAKRALHRRNGNVEESTKLQFLMFLPCVYDEEIDTMNVTPDISRIGLGEYREVHGTLYSLPPAASHQQTGVTDRETSAASQKNSVPDPSAPLAWNPSSVDHERVQYWVRGEWVPCPGVTLRVPPSTEGITEISLLGRADFSETKLANRCFNRAFQVLKCQMSWMGLNPIGSSHPGTWSITEYNQHHMSLDLNWLMRRLPFFSDGGLVKWNDYRIEPNKLACSTCAPMRPEIRWKLKPPTRNARTGKMVPYEDVLQAGTFETAWKARPSPISLDVSIAQSQPASDPAGTIIARINVQTLVHRAIGQVPARSDAGPLKVLWRLDAKHAPETILKAPHFSIPSNSHDEPCFFKFAGTECLNGKALCLRPDQARSLAWMLKRDHRSTPTFQEEILEESANAMLGWKMEAKVTRSRVVRGGILADYVGYGKTVIIVALAKSTIETAQHEASIAQSEPPIANDTSSAPKRLIPIKATCIVAPTTLISQWESEIEKFWPDCELIVLRTAQDLNKWTMADLVAAEIVVVSTVVFVEKKALERLADLSSLPNLPKQHKPREFQAWSSAAQERLEQNTLHLLKQGPQGFVEHLQARHDQYNGDWAAYNTEPSKRHRGAAFQKEKKKASKPQVPLETTTTIRSNIRGFEVESIKDVTGLALHMFEFHRKVVDEQTYIEGTTLQAILSLRSRSTWILSATPRLADFVDVQRLAGFLGIHLGVQDITSSVTSPRNVALVERDRTEVEKFESRQIVHTPEWHYFRDECAQRFLDTFARRNLVDQSAISMTEHFMPVRMDLCHQLVYASTQAQILFGSFWSEINSVLSTLAGAEDQYLSNLLRILQSETTHMALSHVANYNPWRGDLDQSSHTDDISRMIQMLKTFENNIFDKLTTSIANVKAKAEILLDDDPEMKLADLTSNLQAGIGDASVLELIDQLCSCEVEQITKEAILQANDHSIGTEKLEAVTRNHIRNSFRSNRVHAREFGLVYVQAKRAKRLMSTVARLQQVARYDPSHSWHADCGCYTPPVHALLCAQCGHVCCRKCYASHGICPVEGCDALLRDDGMILSYQMCFPTSPEPAHGSKIDSVINIIQSTSDDVRIVVFSQFDFLTERISAALENACISYVSVRDKNVTPRKLKQAEMELARFKLDEPGHAPVKVLILNPTDASAAGHNLIKASTVIFVSPLDATGNQAFHDAYTQSIGRVRRFGQTREVHVYHLLTLQTFEVDVMEQRRNVKFQWKDMGELEMQSQIASDKGDTEDMVEANQIDCGSWAYRCEDRLAYE